MLKYEELIRSREKDIRIYRHPALEDTIVVPKIFGLEGEEWKEFLNEVDLLKDVCHYTVVEVKKSIQ